MGGIPEIISDGATGFLIEPGDSERISKLIELVKNDPNLAADLKMRAKDHVRSQFSVEKMAFNIERIYRDI